jgi:hypothetical protein
LVLFGLMFLAKAERSLFRQASLDEIRRIQENDT